MERLKQVAVGDMHTVRALTSSALRSKLRLSGKDKRGRIFLPWDAQQVTLGELERLLQETFPISGFPVAIYVKACLEEGQGRSMLSSDEQLRAALDWAVREGIDLHVYLDVHPEYEEEPPPEWLVGVPDPGLADQWEMLSFYRFVQIDHPEAFANMLQRAWSPLGVRGRVYVATEGVNAQMAVPVTSSQRFDRAVEAVEKLAGVYINRAERRWSREEFMKDPPFPALHVRARHQIVADGLQEPLVWSESSGQVGKGLSPAEWHGMLGTEGVTVLDCRNAYESEVGVFEEAVPLGTSFFRESWGELERLVGNADRDKPIMTYCTGGIRCVKIAAYLEQEMGFTNVTRLEGGIVSYSKFAKEKGLESKFKGVNYVFDKRMGDRVTSDMLSKCHQCGQPCADHGNCANPCCHARFIQCSGCAAEYEGCCSRGCRDQRSRQDLRARVMRAERRALLAASSASPAELDDGGDGCGNGRFSSSEAGAEGMGDAAPGQEGGGTEMENLMWLVWPFQDPTLNAIFDHAFDEHRRAEHDASVSVGEGSWSARGGAPSAEAGRHEGASRLIGIVSRLAGAKRALALGLGDGGAAGRAALRRLVAALGAGGEVVAVEGSEEAAAAARGLSMVAGARGCRVTVIVCNEEDLLERLGVPASLTASSTTAARRVEGEAVAPRPIGLFDVILLGDVRGEKAATSIGAGQDEDRGGGARSPSARLDLVLDKRLIKKTGLVMCDPSWLEDGETAANRLAARASDIRGTIEHARVPGAGPQGGLHILKYKTYYH